METPGLTCTKCGVELVIGETWNQGSVRKKEHVCRDCLAKAKAASRNRASDAKHLWQIAKDRASKKNLEFAITIEDVEKVDSDVCPYLEIPIKLLRS